MRGAVPREAHIGAGKCQQASERKCATSLEQQTPLTDRRRQVYRGCGAAATTHQVCGRVHARACLRKKETKHSTSVASLQVRVLTSVLTLTVWLWPEANVTRRWSQTKRLKHTHTNTHKHPCSICLKVAFTFTCKKKTTS